MAPVWSVVKSVVGFMEAHRDAVRLPGPCRTIFRICPAAQARQAPDGDSTILINRKPITPRKQTAPIGGHQGNRPIFLLVWMVGWRSRASSRAWCYRCSMRSMMIAGKTSAKILSSMGGTI